jgi:hypothetical protein
MTRLFEMDGNNKSFRSIFFQKKIHLDTHQKNPYHFEQVDFNMFVVIGWSYFLLAI